MLRLLAAVAAAASAGCASPDVQPAYARYGERPPLGRVDLLAGRLDGIVWRVTPAPDGEPLLYDSIHPCGCYHKFFPTPRARARPGIAERQRPLIGLASGTHYIEAGR